MVKQYYKITGKILKGWKQYKKGKTYTVRRKMDWVEGARWDERVDIIKIEKC